MEAIEKKFLHIEEMLARILDNQAVIMKALGCSAADEVVNIEKLLPQDLRGRHVKYEILERAVSTGLMTIVNGRLTWQGGSKTLLAYLCGRVWSGDYTRKHVREGSSSWMEGNRTFPGEALAEFFGVKNLKQLRNNRISFEPPKDCVLVDCLFQHL